MSQDSKLDAIHSLYKSGHSIRSIAHAIGYSKSKVGRLLAGQQQQLALASLDSKVYDDTDFLASLRSTSFADFWQAIGECQPQKIGGSGIFDYEAEIIDILENKSKYISILKATGIGITTLCLRYIAWKCLKDDAWKNRQVVIVTGPNQDLAIKLMRRLKRMFEPHGISFDNKMTACNLNGVEIECYPSHHVDAFRSLDDVACVYISEGDFFPTFQQVDIRHVSERYISKSDPYIIIESTPNAPGGLMSQLINEQDSIYYRLQLPYTVGIDKIYTAKTIEHQKRSISFEREYNLKFSGIIGNSFRPQDIQAATTEYDIEPNPNVQRIISIDPAWGSSNFGIVITEPRNDKIYVLLSEEHSNSSSAEMLPYMFELMERYKPISTLYCDSAAVDVIRLLKKYVGEEQNYQEVRKRYEAQHMDYELSNQIIDVNFQKQNVWMQSHLRMIMEKNYLMVDKRFDLLLNSLYNCSEENGHVIKNFVGNDCYDALRMNMLAYEV